MAAIVAGFLQVPPPPLPVMADANCGSTRSMSSTRSTPYCPKAGNPRRKQTGRLDSPQRSTK